MKCGHPARKVLTVLSSPDRMVWVVLLVLVIACSLASPLFLTPRNLRNVFLVQPIGLGLAALGQAFIVIAGGIDLSVGSIISLLTSIAAGIFAGDPSFSPVLMVFFLLAMGAALGAINGFVVARLGVTPFMATLAMKLIYQGAALSYAKKAVGGIPRPFRFIADGTIAGVNVSVILFVAVLAITFAVLNRSRFGKHCYAVGADPKVSAISGIGIGRVRFASYVAGGMLFGLASIFLAARMGGGGPKVGTGYELDAITAIVIGGVSLAGGAGSLIGAVGGVLILGVFYNIMNLMSLNSFLQILIKGIVLILAVAFYSRKGASRHARE
jgi:ribose/xylose/arabinose/galactoside ABC-type transport system permease subunit